MYRSSTPPSEPKRTKGKVRSFQKVGGEGRGGSGLKSCFLWDSLLGSIDTWDLLGTRSNVFAFHQAPFLLPFASSDTMGMTFFTISIAYWVLVPTLWVCSIRRYATVREWVWADISVDYWSSSLSVFLFKFNRWRVMEREWLWVSSRNEVPIYLVNNACSKVYNKACFHYNLTLG